MLQNCVLKFIEAMSVWYVFIYIKKCNAVLCFVCILFIWQCGLKKKRPVWEYCEMLCSEVMLLKNQFLIMQNLKFL